MDQRLNAKAKVKIIKLLEGHNPRRVPLASDWYKGAAMASQPRIPLVDNPCSPVSIGLAETLSDLPYTLRVSIAQSHFSLLCF